MRTNPTRTARALPWVCLITAIAALLIIAILRYRSLPPVLQPYEPPPRSFEGSSDKLTRTVIVPTLDTPIPKSKSAIWCSSFQLAWNRLSTDVTKGPPEIRNAEEVCERLNKAAASEADLPPGTFYAAAGFNSQGIAEKIQRDMAQKFPDVRLPDLSGNVAVAYAYLRTDAKFKFPFLENDAVFKFQDSEGNERVVSSFGIRESDMDNGIDTFRSQVDVLFWNQATGNEFVLDLCKYSEPNQVVVARVPRHEDLAASLTYVQELVKSPPEGHQRSLGSKDKLFVPTMRWRIDHHFRELEGMDKVFLNPNVRTYLATAIQTIDWTLDRNGAQLSSEAFSLLGSAARFFHFNRPYLIYMRKRDAKHPFFVMWIDNAELMSKGP